MRSLFQGSPTGFTLIELLIVIAIILILIAIALPNFLEAQIRAKVTAAKSEMRALGQATAAYYNDFRRDPEPDRSPPSPDNGMDRFWWGFASHRLTSPIEYISSIPVDPFPDTTGALLWGWTGIDPVNNLEINSPYLAVTRTIATSDLGVWQPGDEVWSFAHVFDDPQYRYRDMTYGLAEGFCLTAEHVYVVLDNNGDQRVTAPGDTRPLLLIFKRPDQTASIQ